MNACVFDLWCAVPIRGVDAALNHENDIPLFDVYGFSAFAIVEIRASRPELCHTEMGTWGRGGIKEIVQVVKVFVYAQKTQL